MNAKTLKALKASIAHWKRMREKRRGAVEQPSRSTCPLCAVFFPDRFAKSACVGCPVAAATGQRFCRGTPYRHAEFAFNLCTATEWRKAATAEIKFLESLLPKKH